MDAVQRGYLVRKTETKEKTHLCGIYFILKALFSLPLTFYNYYDAIILEENILRRCL